MVVDRGTATEVVGVVVIDRSGAAHLAPRSQSHRAPGRAPVVRAMRRALASAGRQSARHDQRSLSDPLLAAEPGAASCVALAVEFNRCCCTPRSSLVGARRWPAAGSSPLWPTSIANAR